MTDVAVKVKICGICDIETATAAVNAGADALGFVFAPSKRRISPETAREIIKRMPPFVTIVGVFVNPTINDIVHITSIAGLEAIQLHGDESPEFCDTVMIKVIKSFTLTEKKDLELTKRYKVDAYLFDTSVPGNRGGSGKTFDWRLASHFEKGPVILAGGLTSENVREAIEIVGPYSVDVSSGVETNGRKDPNKIREFIRRVKG